MPTVKEPWDSATSQYLVPT